MDAADVVPTRFRIFKTSLLVNKLAQSMILSTPIFQPGIKTMAFHFFNQGWTGGGVEGDIEIDKCSQRARTVLSTELELGDVHRADHKHRLES